MNLNYFYKTKKIIYIFVLLNILIFISNISFAAQNNYKQRSLYDTVMEQGVFSINVQPVPTSNLPPAGNVPIDNLIKQISRQDGFVTYPNSQTALRQQRLNFLKKNRITFLKWSKGAIKKLDSYMIANKGSLEALNNLQIFAEIVKCHQNRGTPEQCAQQAGKDALMRMAGGTLIKYLGLGSMATFGALAMANYEAVIKTVELYNEVTGLIEDEKMAEQQKNDRMALGAGVRSMKSYLELMLVRYEQNQDSVANLLVQFWEDAEDQSKRLEITEKEFIDAWKKIENKNYPDQLQNNCEKGCDLDEKCSALVSFYTVLTGNSLPEAGVNTSFLTNEFQDALNISFEKKCIAHSDDIKKKIEIIIQKKVDPLHHGYKSLDFLISHAKQAREKYLADQKKYLRKNTNISQHYEQQLAERYGQDSDKYKEGMAVLDRITNQMKTYQPQRLKGNIKYIFKRINTIEEDFEFTKKRLARVFDGIETYIEKLDKVNKKFKPTALSKSGKLASKFRACADERIHIPNQTANIVDETAKDNVQAKKLCNETKHAATALFSKIQNNEKKFISFGAKLKAFFKKLKALKQESKFIKTAHKNLEKKAAAIAEISHELEKLTLKICETTKELNDHTKTDSEHDQNYDWINNKKESLKEHLESANNIIKNADAIEKKSKKRLEAVKLLKNTAQAALQKIDKDIQSLLETNFGESMDELNKKAAMMSKDNCPEDVFTALREATKHYQKNQDKVTQITAFYKTIKTDFDKKAQEVDNLDQIYQMTAYLLDLAKAYVERAENAAVKGAFCTVLAENIMEKVFIPDVRGMEINNAASIVSQKGLNVTRSEIGPPSSQTEAGMVENIVPGITKRVKKGTNVTLSFYDERPDRQSQLANYDCRRWPGSQPVWDTPNDRPACGCTGNMVWNQDNTRCISRIDAALANANCGYPNSYPVWNPNQNQVMCECIPGTVWNRDRSACIDQRQAALENFNCSQYPGTIPNYDNNGNLGCACPGVTEWIPNMNRCVDQQEIALTNADCSHKPGSAPRWNYLTNQVECECQSPYSQDYDTGKCVDFLAQLEEDNRRFEQEMADRRRQNQEQNQQIINNFMDMIYGSSQPSNPGSDNSRSGNEICGDGIDNNGNNEIDEGCQFNLEIILDDNECPDDTMGLTVDGQYDLGSNPAGHKRHFNLSGLSRGQHTVQVYGVKSGGKTFGCADNKVITYSIEFGSGIKSIKGYKKKSGKIKEGESKTYTIMVQ